MISDDSVHGSAVTVRAIGGPTVVLELGGLRLLTDPTFDPAGTRYELGPVTLQKTAGPAVREADLDRIDAVLLSHDQHPDHLDAAGRRLLHQVPHVYTTESGAARLGLPHAVGVAPWSQVTLERPSGEPVQVTAVPARHGPPGSEALTGEVVGFVIAGAGLPTVYVSGDNVSLDHVRAIADRFDIDVAVLHVGGAQLTPFGAAHLSMTAAAATEAAAILQARAVVPVHCDGWGHFTEGRAELEAAFGATEHAASLRWPELGAPILV